MPWSKSPAWKVARVKPAPAALVAAARELIASVQKLGKASLAISVLGAPGTQDQYPDDLTNESLYNPLKACEWRRVLCGREGTGVLQLLVDGITLTKAGVPREMLELKSLRGFAISGSGKGEGAKAPEGLGSDVRPLCSVCCGVCAGRACRKGGITRALRSHSSEKYTAWCFVQTDAALV